MGLACLHYAVQVIILCFDLCLNPSVNIRIVSYPSHTFLWQASLRQIILASAKATFLSSFVLFETTGQEELNSFMTKSREYVLNIQHTYNNACFNSKQSLTVCETIRHHREGNKEHAIYGKV